MISQERYGIRPDGNPVTEITQYQEVAPDHPFALQLEGIEGYWTKTMVGNSLTALGAREVTYVEYLDAGEEIRLKSEAMMEELQRQRDQRAQELDAKKDQVRLELATLGLSPETINTILAQVREGV